MDDVMAGFNAEQRAYADDERRRLDYTIDFRCPSCDRSIPMGRCWICEEEDGELAEAGF